MTTKLIRPLDCLTWRRIILDKGKFERTVNGAWCRANPDSYEIIYKEVGAQYTQISTLSSFELIFSGITRMGNLGEQDLPQHRRNVMWENHPLVNKGLAFWINNRTLITGYRLLGRPENKEIYRPIFQIERENLNFKLRDEIRKYAKFLVAEKRQMLYQKTLMNIEELKKIPEFVIMKIALFTYDPFSYLKL